MGKSKNKKKKDKKAAKTKRRGSKQVEHLHLAAPPLSSDEDLLDPTEDIFVARALPFDSSRN